MNNQQGFFRFFPVSPSAFDWLRRFHPDMKPDRIGSIVESIENPAKQDEDAPLYLRLLTGIGALIACLFLLYMLYLFGLFSSSDQTKILIGLAFIMLAAGLYRAGMKAGMLKQDFLVQLALSFLQAGKIVFLIGVFFWIRQYFGVEYGWPLTLALFVLALLSHALFPSAFERFMASLWVLVSCWVLIPIDLPSTHIAIACYGLLIAHFFGIAVFLVSTPLRRRHGSVFDALLISLCIGIASLFLINEPGLQHMLLPEAILLQSYIVRIIMGLALMALFAWIVWRQGSWNVEILLFSLVGIISVSLVTDPGIQLGLFLMIMGYATHRSAHIMLGLVFTAGFLIHYYYALNLTLMQKSAILFVSGLLLLAGVFYIYWRGWLEHKEPQASQEEPQEEISGLKTGQAASSPGRHERFAGGTKIRAIAILAILAIILGVFNYTIFEKEKLLKSGEIVLLELAPVDPRSLMQGDYMRLSYSIADKAKTALAVQTTRELTHLRKGYLVIAIDKNKIARFSHLYQGEDLAQDERLISFHRTSSTGRIAIRPASYFFQEGQAEIYEKARFGIIRLAPSGAHLLVGLADKEGKAIAK